VKRGRQRIGWEVRYTKLLKGQWQKLYWKTTALLKLNQFSGISVRIGNRRAKASNRSRR